MSFRKSRDAYRHKRQWERFREANLSLIDQTGLPWSYVEHHHIFVDFLMHGYVDHHEDSLQFTTDLMTLKQKTALFELVRAYFRAGFSYPGLALFSHEQMKVLEKEFPAAFSW